MNFASLTTILCVQQQNSVPSVCTIREYALTSFSRIFASCSSRSSQLTPEVFSGTGFTLCDFCLRNDPVSTFVKRPKEPRRDRTSGDGTVGLREVVLALELAEGGEGAGAGAGGAGLLPALSCDSIC